MIPKDKAMQLIAIYLYICKLHDEELKHMIQRYTNNDKPEFTDQEMMTVYLFCVQKEQRWYRKYMPLQTNTCDPGFLPCPLTKPLTTD
jgi:hypothetical protein